MSLIKSDDPGVLSQDRDLLVGIEDRFLPADSAIERAFAEKYTRLYPRMIAAVRRVIPSHEHDVVQDAFIWFLRRFTKLPPEKRTDACIWRAVRNGTINLILREARLVSLPDDESDDAIPVPPAEQWSDQRELLWRLIDQLPARRRLIFCLVRVLGASREEAAEELGIGLETVKTHLRRATVFIAAGAAQAGVVLGDGRSTTLLLASGAEEPSND